MHVVSTWSSSNSVYFSDKLGQSALVIAKSNKLEVIELAPDGFHHKCGLEVWGTITSLNVLKQSVSIKAFRFRFDRMLMTSAFSPVY